jgi:preprotein translocase subunit SecG
MTARGTGDLLTRTTQILAAVFFGLCLTMTLITGHVRRESALANSLKTLTVAPTTAPAQSGAPAAPAPAQGLPAGLTAPPTPVAQHGDGLNLFGNTPAAGPVAPHPAAATPAQAAPKKVAVAHAAPAPQPAAAAPAPASPAPSAPANQPSNP